MRKGLKEEILNRCKITELNIDVNKPYIIYVEVGNLDPGAISEFLHSVAAVFKQKFNTENWIFASMVDGKEMFNIRQVTEEEVDYITGLYNRIKSTKSSE